MIIVLIGGSSASYRYVKTNTQIMSTLLESVEASITVQKWEGAQTELNIAQQNWNNDNTWWSIILDRQEMDNININLKCLEKYIGIQDVSQSLGEVTTLKLQFEDILDHELFTLNNIF